MAEIKKFHPAQDRILVKREEPEKETKGGIVLPDSVADKSNIAIVMAVGEGKYDEAGNFRKPLNGTLQIGRRVAIAGWGGTEIEIRGTEMLVIGPDDILGIVE